MSDILIVVLTLVIPPTIVLYALTKVRRNTDVLSPDEWHEVYPPKLKPKQPRVGNTYDETAQ